MNKEFQVIMDEIQKIATVSPELAEKVASNILGRIGGFVDDLKGVGIAPAVDHRYNRYIDGVKEFGISREDAIKDIVSGAKKGEPLTNDQFILMEIAKRDEALAKVLMGAGIGIGAGAGIAAHNALNNRQEKTAGLIGILKGDNVNEVRSKVIPRLFDAQDAQDAKAISKMYHLNNRAYLRPQYAHIQEFKDEADRLFREGNAEHAEAFLELARKQEAGFEEMVERQGELFDKRLADLNRFKKLQSEIDSADKVIKKEQLKTNAARLGTGASAATGIGYAVNRAHNNSQEKTAGLIGVLKGDNVAEAAKNKWAARQRVGNAKMGLSKLDHAPYDKLDELKASLDPGVDDYQRAVFELESADELYNAEKIKTLLARLGVAGTTGAGAYGAHSLLGGEEEKTAGLIDVLTGKAMRNAGKSVVGASDELAGVLDRKAQTLDELKQFQGQIGEAEEGVRVLQDGRLKREALEFARNTAKGQALDAAELAQQQAQKLKGYSVSDRLAGMHTQDKTKYNMLAKGQVEANDMFSDADRAYREYMDELHSKANKPLIDKMTPEYIGSETERFRGSLGGITQEIQQKQDEIKALQKEYGKQKKLKWGARAGVGAGAVGAGALYNRPYTDQSNYDPMMVTAAEADYLEKIANVGAILTGAKAMGKGIASLAGKAGQRAAGYVDNMTGSTVRGLKRTAENSAGDLARANKGLDIVDRGLSRAMNEGNLAKADEMQDLQRRFSQKVTDATNVNREATAALPGARKAMNRARIGTAVGVGGLMAGNAISDSAEDRQEEQQQFYSSPYAQRFS